MDSSPQNWFCYSPEKESTTACLLASLQWQKFLVCTSKKASTMCCTTLPLKQHPEQLPSKDNFHMQVSVNGARTHHCTDTTTA